MNQSILLRTDRPTWLPFALWATCQMASWQDDASHAMSESHDFCIHVYITESFLDILSHRSYLFRIDMYIKQSIRYFYY